MIKRLIPYLSIYFLIETVLRVSLLARGWLDVEFEPNNILTILAKGLWMDTVTAGFFLIPVVLYHLFLPAKFQFQRIDRKIDAIFRLLFTFILLFDAVAEHLFWTEFTTRFNFIAVDYLVYTQEVIGNITESYPLFWIIAAIAVSAFILSWLSLKLLPMPVIAAKPFKKRIFSAIAYAALSGVLYMGSSIEQSSIKDNAEASELAANGIYNLFSAFWNNEISYSRFYASLPDTQIEENARVLLGEDGNPFLHKDGKDLTRLVQAKGKENHKNVILVVMESMSADYMGTFGNNQGLTPNLDKLAKEGLLFSQLYATGTRTVRGLEAVTLSIPPTPGQSIIRRPGNANLFSLGFVFKDRGYDTKFIYGGYGYFDNMNAFFEGNGFDILDRTKMSKQETNFANVWGICDEDMFTRAIREADSSYANGKPFFDLIMTTSNHRPYTYPSGRIDIPSHSNRIGGVKYADYSVGKLIEEAKTKPWFKDTIFIFVADHTAGAGGKAELDPKKYHIPMIFYAPGMIKKQTYDKVASQIDMAPTLLGMLNFSYYTKFYGEDLLHDSDEIPHTFISNYQKVGLVKEDGLTVLAPKRKIEAYSWPDMKPEQAPKPLVQDTITYYQSASWWKEQYGRIDTVVKSHKSFATR